MSQVEILLDVITCCQTLRFEPPSADPHARWCGRVPGAIRAPIPIDCYVRLGASRNGLNPDRIG